MTMSLFLQNMAAGMVGIFEPVYLFQLGYSLRQLAFFYLIVYVVYLGLIPLGSKIARRLGFVHAVAYALPVQMAYFILLAIIPIAPWAFFVAPLVFAIAKTLYWPGYHADLALYSGKGQRGQVVGITLIATGLGVVIGPMIGGAIAEAIPFSLLFIIASVIMGLAVIPLFQHKEEFVPSSMPYLEPWRALRDVAMRPIYFAMGGFVEEAIALAFWPIFFLTIGGSLFNIGVLMSIASIFVLTYGYFVGRKADASDFESVAQPHALILALSWLIRIFWPTPIGAVVGLTASGIGKEGSIIPIYAGVYGVANAQHTVARVTAVEIALIIAKIFTFSIALLLTFFTDDLRSILLIAPIGALWFLIFRMPSKREILSKTALSKGSHATPDTHRPHPRRRNTTA